MALDVSAAIHVGSLSGLWCMSCKTVTCPESWKNTGEELVSVGSLSSLSLPVFPYIFQLTCAENVLPAFRDYSVFRNYTFNTRREKREPQDIRLWRAKSNTARRFAEACVTSWRFKNLKSEYSSPKRLPEIGSIREKSRTSHTAYAARKGTWHLNKLTT